jgi:hypothetical protein
MGRSGSQTHDARLIRFLSLYAPSGVDCHRDDLGSVTFLRHCPNRS